MERDVFVTTYTNMRLVVRTLLDLGWTITGMVPRDDNAVLILTERVVYPLGY